MGGTIARYQLLEQVGRGGLGLVHRARDTSLGRTVALKLITPDLVADPTLRERLLAAARAITSLSHPNIAALVEAGEEQGQVFLAFEFASGETLRQIVGDRPMPVRRALNIAIQISDALGAAHAKGIVHGDLKPSNIVITSTGRAKILDFGLGRWTGGGDCRRKAAAGELAGSQTRLAALTVPYMSPEQAAGAEGDTQSDVFSLGVILYEMLTGVSPFAAPTTLETLAQVREGTPRPLATLNPMVPPRLGAAVMRSLSKDAEERHRHLQDFQRELRLVATMLDSKAADASIPVPRQQARRRSKVALIAGLVVALVTVAWALLR
jgi:serine/threonine protein kinase